MSEQESQIALIFFGGAFLTILMCTFIVSMVVLHRQRQVQNQQKLDHLKSEYEKTILNIENEIQQETLSQIGRELHDNIGQLLSLAKLNFGSLKPEKHVAGRDILQQVIQEVRGLSKTLNLDWVESISLEEFIHDQLKKIEATGFCSTALKVKTELGELPKDQKLVLIRVVQETLNNAIKHAAPDKIEITIQQLNGTKELIIQDNGNGFDTTRKSEGSGMYNLNKRMETIGGKFIVTSVVGKGTLIKLFLPN